MPARLSAVKTLAGLDFAFQPSLDRNRILALAELKFIDRAEVVHLLGPPGTGKSHLATALAVEAVKAGRSVAFSTLADIIAWLVKAEREGQLKERIRFLARASLLVVDEIGYLPVTPGEGNLFFQLVNARYEKGAMILTSNRGFAEWGEVFGDRVVATALLDRLLHHAIVIQIEDSSYRLRQHVGAERGRLDAGDELAGSAPFAGSIGQLVKAAYGGLHPGSAQVALRVPGHRYSQQLRVDGEADDVVAVASPPAA